MSASAQELFWTGQPSFPLEAPVKVVCGGRIWRCYPLGLRCFYRVNWGLLKPILPILAAAFACRLHTVLHTPRSRLHRRPQRKAAGSVDVIGGELTREHLRERNHR